MLHARPGREPSSRDRLIRADDEGLPSPANRVNVGAGARARAARQPRCEHPGHAWGIRQARRDSGSGDATRSADQRQGLGGRAQRAGAHVHEDRRAVRSN